jgi:hypothetical protein
VVCTSGKCPPGEAPIASHAQAAKTLRSQNQTGHSTTRVLTRAGLS